MKVETLNLKFENLCKTNYCQYKRINENKIIIPSFFEDFKRAKKFFLKRDVWETNLLDGNLKPGFESIFPNWLSKSLLNKFFLENQISLNEDPKEFTTFCNYLYDGIKKYDQLLSSYSVSDCVLPHVDGLKNDENYLSYICLVNLSNFPVTTLFWEYKSKPFCENITEMNDFNNFLYEKSLEYLELKDQKIDFHKNIKELKIVDEITYNPNEAFIYPANFYHSPKVEKINTRQNPRILLRLTYKSLVN
jgi:hypothetical protein